MINMGFFINGKEVMGDDSSKVLNPADGSVVGTIASGNEKIVDVAVSAAKNAFECWWAFSAARRGEILYSCANAVKSNVDELSALLTSEQGKPIKEAKMEIFRFAHTLEHYAGMAKSLRGGSVPNLDHNPARMGLILKRPLGVCGAITPWNFPLSLAGNKLGPGLIAGNTFVLKPASTTPLTVLKVAAIMFDAGLPAGVLNVVCGPGGVVGERLATHPDVAKIGFTGSTPVGKDVMSKASSTVKRVTLELGGSDPFIVMSDADIDKAVSACSVGRFFNCGQACLAVKRVFVDEPIYEEFKEKLVEKVKKITVGSGFDTSNRMGPLHTEGQREEVEGQFNDAVNRGAKILIGGNRPSGDSYDKGNYLMPTVLENCSKDSKMNMEEVFGPALPLWRVSGMNEAIERANDSPFGLGSSVWTRDLDAAMRAAEKIESGYTWINSISKIYDELPFGGMKESGLGSEHGYEALEHYMATKSVVMGINEA